MWDQAGENYCDTKKGGMKPRGSRKRQKRANVSHAREQLQIKIK